MESPRFAFLGSSGVNVDSDDETSVLECFQKFIFEDMLQLFAEKTNKYANQFLTTNPNLKSWSWARTSMDTNLTEMKTLIDFSVFRYCTETWEWNVFLQNRKYCHAILLTNNDRENIPTPPEFLHFADNSKFDPDQHHKKLYKIQAILDQLKSKFSSIYTPEPNISVDKSLLLWKGRLVGFNTYYQSEAGLERKSSNSVKAAQAMFGTSQYTLVRIPFMARDTQGSRLLEGLCWW